MPATKRSKPLYQRGKYSLYRRPDRPNLEIVWYDTDGKRERGVSASTSDVAAGRLALDRKFLSEAGAHHCPTCHRPWDTEQSPLLASVIADYLVLSEGKAGERSARGRLAHVIDYISSKPGTRVTDVDERWAEAFRTWLLARPYTKGKTERPRSIGHVEGCLVQLAAAINATPGQSAPFKPGQLKDVAKSPWYRADIPMLARMFRFAMAEPHRANLLRYLRMAVATWARPDAIFDAKPDQWLSHARVLNLNQTNRRQTKKHRPRVPIARQFAPYLDSGEGFIPVAGVRAPWEKMRVACGLPQGREAGEKLIRRTMATLARNRIGEAQWIQGKMMLGHMKSDISDIYALPDPANLGLALAATESIIEEIDQLAPGAFYRNHTASGATLSVVEGGKKC